MCVGQIGSILNIRYKTKNKYNNKDSSYAFTGTHVAKEKSDMGKTENILNVK